LAETRPNSSATSLTCASSFLNGWPGSAAPANMSALLRATIGPASDVGGGDIRDMDRLRESSTWAFFECDMARCGIAGASIELLLDGRTPAVVADR